MSNIFQKKLFQVGVSLETLAAAMSQMARIGEIVRTGFTELFLCPAVNALFAAQCPVDTALSSFSSFKLSVPFFWTKLSFRAVYVTGPMFDS